MITTIENTFDEVKFFDNLVSIDVLLEIETEPGEDLSPHDNFLGCVPTASIVNCVVQSMTTEDTTLERQRDQFQFFKNYLDDYFLEQIKNTIPIEDILELL